MLAHTLRQTRLKKNFSVEQLSKRSGVPGWVIRNMEGESASYVPSEGNTALLAEALKLPLGSLLAERDRLVELLHHRAYEVAKEYRGVST